MGLFDKAKDLYTLQKQAKQVKQKLKAIHIEAEHDGVKVVINAEQTFLEASVAEALAGDLKRIANGFVEAANKAVKKAQSIAAEKMKGVMGGMGFGK